MQRITGSITYELTYKKVKNINLRISRDGMILVSANKRVPLYKIDEFVSSKAEWIERTRAKVQYKIEFDYNFTDDKCRKVIYPICERVYALLGKYILQMPNIKFRNMKSCWGVCHYTKNYITFNRALLSKPQAAIEYVVLHEFVHFIEPNHQQGFHKIMGKLMPDYLQRRKMLT